MTKRANNEGSIWRRQDGRWCGAYYVPRAGGRGRVRKYVYGKTRAEAHEKLTEVVRKVQQGEPIPVAGQSVSTYLEEWLTQVAVHRVRPSTLQGYALNVRRHIVPRIGRKRLGALTPRDIRLMVDDLRASGLSARSIQYIHATLRVALEHAVREEMLPRNAARLVQVPAPARHQREPLSVDEARTLLRAAREDRLFALYVVSLMLGLRRSEALGLRWDDVDFERGVLRIRQTLHRVNGSLQFLPTKTVRSRRTVPLPESVGVALHEHQSRQERERDEARVWLASGLVFVTVIGTPIDPTNFTHRFQKLCERAGVRRVRLHDLRHTCVSLLLAIGEHPRLVMEIVGHSALEMTMNVYGHVNLDSQRSALKRLDDLLGG